MQRLSLFAKVFSVLLIGIAGSAALPSQGRAPGLLNQNFRTLYNFCSQSACTDGTGPSSPLMQAANGNLYGTASQGGNVENPLFSGTMFSIDPSGNLKTVASFCATFQTCEGGFDPEGEIVQATNGNIYGTTFGYITEGTVFQLTPSATLSTLYNFCLQECLDGNGPDGLIQASDGAFYGATIYGGYLGDLGYGTLFKITTSGALKTLYNFCPDDDPCPDGAYPEDPLAQGSDGSLYGLTSSFGANGGGTVFRITAAGEFTTIYNFCSQPNCADGDGPNAGLILGPDGDFYGTTSRGGTTYNCINDGECGTVFKITPAGKLTTLYSFCSQSNCTDGYEPRTELAQGTDGNLYGTTSYGGALDKCGAYSQPGCGTLFRITPTGIFTTLHVFQGPDGQYSNALFQATSGLFYGTTAGGGTGASCNPSYYPGCGTAFELSVGLGPFVRTNPATGRAGQTVGILGTNLEGATSVTFNGAETAFRIVSKAFIEAKVPSGAASGKVQVVTPAGTLSSNVPFIVLH